MELWGGQKLLKSAYEDILISNTVMTVTLMGFVEQVIDEWPRPCVGSHKKMLNGGKQFDTREFA